MRSIALALSRWLEVVGLKNIQLAVLRPRSAMEAVYVIEVNPRASMTVPVVCNACMANIPAAM
jgi:carbamoyl-phosphate synthase large subunit